MKTKLDMEKIARGLGAKHRGKVRAGSGHFGARQLVADVQARFQVPKGGGRATDPKWNTKRLVPLTDQTLQQLEQLADKIEHKRQIRIEPMQVAALLLEKTLVHLDDQDAEDLVGSTAVTKRSQVETAKRERGWRREDLYTRGRR